MVDLTKYGFLFNRKRELEEIDATLYEFEHKKTGASLVYLDREDDNKTFSIGFATPPENDTGVFHIIEHSVLCGSEKYPLKDPFAELLKGSLNTFLNAITYEDRTIYPVSSRCEKDFLNLVDVYLDATLTPNLMKIPSIFKQEGWRYEYDEETNSLSVNGVVYNEMKGAYSSPDELGMAELNRLLYSDCHYRYDSGGNPQNITDLTYEQVKAAYNKYYHPSNARIVLDGKMNLEKALELIDSHLCRFDRGERTVIEGLSEAKRSPIKTIKYEISENEDEHQKARVLYGFVCGDHKDTEAHLTASILSDVLCGSNASILKKALLERGLAKDATMYSVRSRELALILEIRDADENRLEEIDTTIEEIISDITKSGIPKSMLTSTLNSIDFRLKERDFATLPTGIAFAMSMYGSWVYGSNPEESLLSSEAIASIRGKIDSDYFDQALLKMTIQNGHTAKLIMLPDKKLGELNAEKENKRLKDILANMSSEEIEAIKQEQATLEEWQRADESDLISLLPSLSLSDVPTNSKRPALTKSEIDGVEILKNDTKNHGIVYLSLYFDASDIANEELLDLSMLSVALGNFPTETQDALSLQNDIKANLGSLFVSFATGNRDGIARPYLKIGASSLLTKTDDIIRIIGDLLTSKIDNPEEVFNLASQAKSGIEDGILSAGHSFAMMRTEASYSELGAINEYLSGYEAFRILSELIKDKDKISALTERVRILFKKLTTKDRIRIFVTGDMDDESIARLIALFPDGDGVPTKVETKVCAKKNEFILTPSKVGYAVLGGTSEKIKDNLGAMRVARSILSYEFLWNTVRVQGGAYGTGFVPRRDGSLAFYSYRDPSPERSIESYRQCADYLRELARSGEDITRFIIGAFGEYDMIITPKVASAIAISDYFSNWNADEEYALRNNMLSITAEDLALIANVIDEALRNEYIAIVGSAEQLSTLSAKPDQIIKI